MNSHLLTESVGVVCTNSLGEGSYTGALAPGGTILCIDNIPYAPAPTYKNNGEARRAGVMGYFMMLLLFVWGAVADTAGVLTPAKGPALYVRNTDSSAMVGELEARGVSVVHNIEEIDFAKDVNASYYVLDLKVLLVLGEMLEPNNNLTKRNSINNCRSIERRVKQYQVAQHGYWWSQWTQATSTMLCNQGGGGGVEKDISWTIGYSINVDMGISIEDVISAMLGVGVSVEKSVTRGCAVSCSCSTANHDFEKACVWEQSRLAWSDTQWQWCYIYSDCNGSTMNCDPWSAYQHTNQPFKDANCGTDYQYGCSHDGGCA